MSWLSSVRCPLCHSNAVRPPDDQTAGGAQAFRCNDCGCAWSLTIIRPATGTLADASSQTVAPLCSICGAPAHAIVEPAAAAVRYECRACGTFFTTP